MPVTPDGVASGWEHFAAKAVKFAEKTEEHALHGINPGGVYQAIWCRDASYILKNWFLGGNSDGALQQIFSIWSRQIMPGREKLVYGRGSPEMHFSSEVANVQKQKEFEGALPTTIYQLGFSEIYGQNPDIDSTALMISTTSWILARALPTSKHGRTTTTDANQSSEKPLIASPDSSDYVRGLMAKLGITNPQSLADFVIPRMIKAVDHLRTRDIDNDGLLEQGHNEDWMDTVLRAGKIVYSQACWILALEDLAHLLAQIERMEEANALIDLANRAIQSVEDKLWSEDEGAYVDIQETHHIGGPYRTLTQDVALYLVAITQNTLKDSLWNFDSPQPKTRKIQGGGVENDYAALHPIHHDRGMKTLDALKKRTWKEKWPLVTEAILKATGPWILKPYEYHNHTFWPWTTGIEMLARSRFDRVHECDILLSTLASEGHPHMHAFYEWVNPVTDKPSGAFPFRTGVCAVRNAIADILGNIRRRKKTAVQ
jgi:hypothetical protein